MKLFINQNHIDRANAAKAGWQSKRETCPIAQAFIDMGYDGPDVSGDAVAAMRASDEAYFYGLLPVAARDFIRDYDNEKAVIPFSFEIEMETEMEG